MSKKKVIWTKKCNYMHGIAGRWPVCPDCRCDLKKTSRTQWDCIECESFTYDHEEKKTMKMSEMKRAIIRDSWNWSSQTGPNDQRGYDADQLVLAAVRKARSWDVLTSVAPMVWMGAVVNRCHRDQM